MKKIIGICLGLLALLMPCTEAASLYDCPKVAVVEFKNKAPIAWNLRYADAKSIAINIEDYLLESDLFDIGVRGEGMRDLLDEKSMGMSGITDSEVQDRQLMGVDYLVTGALVGLSTKESSGQFTNIGEGKSVSGDQHTVRADIILRIVDAGTGRIMLTTRGSGASSSGNFKARADDLYVMVGSSRINTVQVTNAIKKASEDAVFGKEGVVARMERKQARQKQMARVRKR